MIDWVSLMQQARRKELLTYREKEIVKENVLQYAEKKQTDLMSINWVWVKTVEAILNAWIWSIEKLKEIEEEKLNKIVTNKITLWIIKKYLSNQK